MNILIGFIVGLVVFVGLGFFTIPWVFDAVKSLFETADIGALVGIVACIMVAGFLGTIAIWIGAFTAIGLETRQLRRNRRR